jgi:hypothetical protein
VDILDVRSGLYLFHIRPKNNPTSPKNIAMVVPLMALNVFTTVIEISILSGFGGQVRYNVAIDIKYNAGTMYEILLTLLNLENMTPIETAIITDII